MDGWIDIVHAKQNHYSLIWYNFILWWINNLNFDVILLFFHISFTLIIPSELIY